MHPIRHASPLFTAAFLALTACNKLPATPQIAIAPDAPTTDDDLVATFVVPTTDSNEEEALTHRYTWYHDGVVRSDFTTDRVPASATTKGEV